MTGGAGVTDSEVTDSEVTDSGKMGLEPSGAESGLAVEAVEGTVIPNKVVGAGDFFLKAALRNPDLVCHRQRQPAKHCEPVYLCLRRASDRNDAVAQGVSRCFVK